MALLIKDGVGRRQFPMSCSKAARRTSCARSAGESHSPRDAEGRVRNAHGMTKGKVGLRVDDIGEGLADLIDLARLQLMLLARVEVEDRLSRVLLAITGRTVCPESAAPME